MSCNVTKMCCLWAAALSAWSMTADAQESPTNPPGSALAPPQIRMVEPHPGGTIPVERPFVRFEFRGSPGGAPVDPSSFALLVNGEDRSRGFSVSPAGASGSIAGAGAPGTPPLPPITPGVQLLAATICTTSRECSTITAAVVVSSTPTTPTPSTTPAAGAAGAGQATPGAPTPDGEKPKRRKLLEAIHAALGKLIVP